MVSRELGSGLRKFDKSATWFPCCLGSQKLVSDQMMVSRSGAVGAAEKRESGPPMCSSVHCASRRKRVDQVKLGLASWVYGSTTSVDAELCLSSLLFSAGDSKRYLVLSHAALGSCDFDEKNEGGDVCHAWELRQKKKEGVLVGMRVSRWTDGVLPSEIYHFLTYERVCSGL